MMEDSHRPWTRLCCVAQKDFVECLACVSGGRRLLRSFSTIFPLEAPDSLSTLQVRGRNENSAQYFHTEGRGEMCEEEGESVGGEILLIIMSVCIT